MEQFDLVNQDDRVIGTTDKPTAHAKKQLHRVAAIYVFTADGDLYVQVHKASGGLLDHSVGGHVSKGEDYATAARREAKEELGITQPLAQLTTGYRPDRGKYGHMYGLFECIADPAWRFVPNDEVEEIIVMNFQDLRNLMNTNPEKFTGGFINTMKEYCRIKNLEL